MCISGIARPSRVGCPGSESWMGRNGGNCSLNFSDLTAMFMTELDAINTVHSYHVNVTRDLDLSEVDVSQFDFPNTIWVVRPAWEVGAKSAAFVPVVLLGSLANILLMSLLLRQRWLRTPTNLLIVNMAAADLVTLLLGPWMLLVHHFFQNYVLGAVGCKMEGFLSAALLITGVMSLSAVSYDRLTAIVLPREARLSHRGAYCLMALTWIIGLLFAMPLCIWRTYKERQWKNFLETYCSENVHVLPVYWHVLLSMLVWFPITVMTICYSAIFWKLERYEQQILRREHPLTVSYKTRAARTMFIVLLTFIVCRLPFTVLVFWRNKMVKEAQINAVDGSFQILWFVSHYLMYLNCAINPVIYGLTNRNYRRAFGTTPLYKWLSGNSKNTKENKNNEVVKEVNLSPEEENRSGCRCWPCGRSNSIFPHASISITRTEVLPRNDNMDKQKIFSEKITPTLLEYM